MLHIPLDDVLVPVDDILDVASEEDSSSLRQCFGFDDVCASLSPIDGLVVVPELAEL